MQTARERLGIFVPLDCLLDTRLATLYGIHSELVPLALADGYHQRDEDIFPHLPKETFREFYYRRNALTLQDALPTQVLGFLTEMVDKLTSAAIASSKEHIPHVIVNVYPYDLTPGEVDLIVKSIILKTKQLVQVTAVYMKDEEITPKYCKDNLSCIFQYDPSYWLEAHAANGAFKNLHIPEVTLYTPMIHHGERPTDELLAELSAMHLTTFRGAEIGMSPIITACYLPTEVFCVDLSLIGSDTS